MVKRILGLVHVSHGHDIHDAKFLLFSIYHIGASIPCLVNGHLVLLHQTTADMVRFLGLVLLHDGRTIVDTTSWVLRPDGFLEKIFLGIENLPFLSEGLVVSREICDAIATKEWCLLGRSSSQQTFTVGD